MKLDQNKKPCQIELQASDAKGQREGEMESRVLMDINEMLISSSLVLIVC